ncbi:MAG TPA: ABC transporter permease [Patescibacteria group bacterium]|nr:ABC transporter permease [Patescibacteria group bacterium]
MRVLWCIIVKEFLQLKHDTKLIPALIIGPLMQLLVLGYAANTDVNDIPALLVDQDRSAASRDLVDKFEGSGYFKIVGGEDGIGAIDPWLIEGRAQIALVIGAGYGEALAAGRPPSVQVIADGSDSNSAVVGLGYASRIIAGVGATMLEGRLAAQAGEGGTAGAGGAGAAAGSGGAGGAGGPGAAAGSIELVPRVWYNPDLKSRWFYVPSILAMTLMLTTMILPSMAVVREKEIGTLEQISVTPIRPWQLIVGKLVPFAVIGNITLLLVTALVVGLFRVPLVGSFVTLVLLTQLFLMSTLGLGLFASTLVSTQQQAMMTATFLLMVPMIYLSGLIFPIENMPVVFQYGTYAIPLRYYCIIIRGIFLKGSGIAVLWPEALALFGFGSVVLLLASARFHKGLD